MSRELFGIITDVVPGGFFGDKLVKLVLNGQIIVEGVYRNWKTVLFRQDFAKRGAAYIAETSVIFVRRSRLINRNLVFSLNPLQMLFFDKNHMARAKFAAPGTMTGAHHRGLSQQLKFYSPATTASLDHVPFSLR
jgi:hypothetical protein